MRFVRAVAAFLVLPGVVAYLVPLVLAPDGDASAGRSLVGNVLLVIGSMLLLWCVRDFYVAGRGTLAPWSPPTRLVTVGLYRFSRNPMYLAVLVVLIGWAVRYTSLALLLYAAFVAAAFHTRVVLYEEPRLQASFGDEWTAYRDRVSRWL